MDPDKMADLLRKVQEASRRGVPLSRLDQEIENRTDGEFSDVRSFAEAARDSGVTRDQLAPAPAPQEDGGGKGFFEGIERAPRIAAELGTFGFIDELAAGLRGLVEGAGAALPGGRSPAQAFREARDAELAASRERRRVANEGAGTGTQILGTLAGAAGPAALGGRAVLGGASALSRIGRGAAAGAAEGGAFGFGSAEGSVSERLPEAGRGAAVGAAAGAAIPAGVDAARVVGKAARAAGGAARRGAGTVRRGVKALDEIDELEELERTIGPRLGEEVREGAGILGQPSRVRAEISEARRGIFGKLDEIEEIADEPLQKALRDDNISPFVPDEVAAGKRPPSFVEAQGAARQANKAKEAALARGDAASFRELNAAERKVRSRLSDAVEGFDEANEAFAQQAARGRALERGSEVATKPFDTVQEAFNALDTDLERQAFRESLGEWFLKRLDDNVAIPTTLKKVQNAPETRQKLRLLFQDDEVFEEFVDAARRAENIREKAKMARVAEREFMRLMVKALPIAGAGGAGLGILATQ